METVCERDLGLKRGWLFCRVAPLHRIEVGIMQLEPLEKSAIEKCRMSSAVRKALGWLHFDEIIEAYYVSPEFGIAFRILLGLA